MILRFCGRSVLLSFAVLCALRCTHDCVPPPPLDTGDIVVSKPASANHPFGVDVCIDATPSMDGFAIPPISIYRTFLEDLEGSLVSGVRNVADVRYFKFGERIRQMTRDDFRSARSRAFYHEPGIFKTTDIELVFDSKRDGAPEKRRPDQRVVIVVTDLFQSDQDVNAVVAQIKQHCLTDSGCSVGVMAIASEFDGTVYDARVPSYRYTSTQDSATFRPFYLLMFGPEEEVRLFADVLSSRRYVDLRRFTVIGPHTISQFSATIERDPSSKGVVPRKQCGSALDAAFNLRRNFHDAAVKARLHIAPDSQSFGFDPSRVEVRAFRESGGKLISAGEVKAATVPQPNGDIEVDATITPPAMHGDYFYTFEILTGETNGYVMPKWIAGLSSNDPRPDHEAAKTLNLDRFVSELIAAGVSDEHHQPKLARFRVLIHKL